MGMFEAKEVDFGALPESEGLNEGTSAGRGFAVSGGVAKAVADLAQEQSPGLEIKTARAEGLRECRKMMMAAKAGKYKGYLLEGMACPGGCVAAPAHFVRGAGHQVRGKIRQGSSHRLSP